MPRQKNPTTMKTAKKLLPELARMLVTESKLPDTSPFSGIMTGHIPERLRTKEIRDSKILSIMLSSTERDKFDETLNALRQERATEYLSDKELKDKLWYFVCEVFLGRENYKKQTEVGAKVDAFLSELMKPAGEYEVLFRILNFDAGTQPLELWGCKVKRYSGKELKDWGLSTTLFHRRTLVELKNQTLIAIKESGNNPTLVLERAKNQAQNRLTALRVYLSEREFVPDEQLLFELGDHAAVKNVQKSKVVLQSWNRGRKPIRLSYNEYYDDSLKEANRQHELSAKLAPKLRSRVDRAIYWIGRSIVEQEPDLKSQCTLHCDGNTVDIYCR